MSPAQPYRGPVELALLWQQQPPGAAEDWAQVLGEILPPAIGGPLPAAQQPGIELVLPEGSARLRRPEVVALVDALQRWLDRTRWTAELPALPEGEPAPRRGAYGVPIPEGLCGAYWADEGGEHMCRRPLDHPGQHMVDPGNYGARR